MIANMPIYMLYELVLIKSNTNLLRCLGAGAITRELIKKYPKMVSDPLHSWMYSYYSSLDIHVEE